MRSKRNYHKQKVSVNLRNQEFKNQVNLKINQQIKNYYRLILCRCISLLTKTIEFLFKSTIFLDVCMMSQNKSKKIKISDLENG